MAAGDATVTTLSNILKTRYDQKKFYQLYYRKAPFAGLIRKDEKFGGNNARISLRYGSPQGGAGVFSVAQTNASTSLDVGFLLTRKKDYQVSGISGEAIAAADGDENTLYNGLKGEMEGSMRNLNRSMQIQGYRNGGGARGKGDGAFTAASVNFVLATPADITNFEVGMFVDGATTDGTSGAKLLAGPLSIVAVNRTTGAITLSANWSTLTGGANTNYIFRNGDFDSVSSMASGLAAWNPDTAPTAGDSFYGVDRSVDAVRLAGVRFNGNGGNKEETLIDAVELTGREGAEDLVCLINNLDRADIVKSLGSKARYEPVKSTDGTIGYNALMIEGADGPVKVVSDVNCPKGYFKLIQPDTWVQKSAGGAPRLLDEDKLQMIREATVDGYQWRMGAYWNIGCEAPGYNCAGTF